MYRPARPRWSDSEKRAGSKDVVSPSCAHHKTPHPRSHSSRHIIDSSRSKLFENKYQIKKPCAAAPGGGPAAARCVDSRRVRVSRRVRPRPGASRACACVACFVVLFRCGMPMPGSRSAHPPWHPHGGRVGGCGMRMGYLRCGTCSSMLQQERSQERDAASVHAGVRERPATEVRVLGLLVLPPRAARGCGSRSQRGTLCLRGVEPPSQIFSSTLYQCRAAPLLSPHLSLETLSLARAPPSDLHITSNGDGAF